MDWLRDGPRSRKPRGLADHLAKIGKLDLAISTILLKSIARPMLYRKPATLRRMQGERRTLEIARFLRLQLLRLTDDGLGMIDHRVADLWRQARGRADAALADELRRHLRAATAIGVDLAPTHPLRDALSTLASLAAAGARSLPDGTANPFGPTWTQLIEQPDREAALGGFRAATLMLLKRSLRNGPPSGVGSSCGRIHPPAHRSHYGV
jgi:hypothetical protein